MRLIACFLYAAMLATFGCVGSTEPAGEVVLTMVNISGTYYGVTFTTVENGVVTDQLYNGASIELVLYADGITAGRLFMPAVTAGGVDLDASLLGTWTLTGKVVRLSHSSDTFLQDMDLTHQDTHLAGETTRDGVTYRVGLAW